VTREQHDNYGLGTTIRSSCWIRDLLRFAYSDEMALPRRPLTILPIETRRSSMGRMIPMGI
jgi:hypothetical protein